MNNQQALNQHQAIFLATIDYLLENAASQVIVDNYDAVGKYYEKLQLKAGKHYRNGNLELLQQVMREISGESRLFQEDSYLSFMKDRTGYDAEVLKQILPAALPDNRKSVIINAGGVTHKKLAEIFSPDNKRKITVHETSRPSAPAMTNVDIQFARSGASVYMVEGTNLDLNVFWKDNNTVVIETRSTYVAKSKHGEQYQSLDDVVKVEYVVR